MKRATGMRRTVAATQASANGEPIEISLEPEAGKLVTPSAEALEAAGRELTCVACEHPDCPGEDDAFGYGPESLICPARDGSR